MMVPIQARIARTERNHKAADAAQYVRLMDLPKELRLNIYTFADGDCQGRIWLSLDGTVVNDGECFLEIRSPRSVPALLLVSRKVREKAEWSVYERLKCGTMCNFGSRNVAGQGIVCLSIQDCRMLKYARSMVISMNLDYKSSIPFRVESLSKLSRARSDSAWNISAEFSP